MENKNGGYSGAFCSMVMEIKKNMKQWVVLMALLMPMSVWAQTSPYIHTVYEYSPAPGQFVNVLPEITAEDTKENVLKKVQNAIAGKANGSAVSLGAWGGYIVVGFDHEVQNVHGEMDLKIYGNAMLNAAEPGVIMVAQDVNENGIPDDAWYELKGSEHDNQLTHLDYEVVYYRPAPNHTPTPHPTQNLISDMQYIAWKAIDGQSGYLEKNTFHNQDYFPSWIKEDSIRLKGTRLPDNAFDPNGNGTFFSMKTYEWGYADNQPNGKDESCVDIDWAVDEKGNPANLTSIDFVKVYTGVFQSNGWTGECSTEIAGMVDLHELKSDIKQSVGNICMKQIDKGIYIYVEKPANFVLYDMLGNKLCEELLTEGENKLQLPTDMKGTFIACVYANNQIFLTRKIVVF